MDRPLLFGKYCLLERTSVGGMAEVFRAKPLDAPDPDRYFALKRILPHLAEDVEFIKMFVDEARLTVQLRHPNIVHIYELGQFQSSHYMVMEFIAGKDLLAFQKLVRRQSEILDVDMACHILLEIAKGLDYAHKKTDEQGNPLGIIHRDISPQNVLVSWDGRVRVIDFGIAKAASQSTKTRAGVLKGKFGYLSPEQVRAQPIDRRSDIFAMGTLFWELLTNQRLFNASNQYETLSLIGEPDVKPPSTQNPKIPDAVDAIAMKALEANPDDRYQWCSEFARDLERYLLSQKPPYHRSQLTTWLRSAFQDEFQEEKQKREEFRAINSAADVRRLFEEEYGPGGGDSDEEEGDATMIWDVDEAPDSDADLEAFVDNHTVVQAGGLDLSDYDDWEEAPDTIDETQDVVESRLEENLGPGGLQRIKIARESQYEVPATMITEDPPAMGGPAAGTSPVSVPTASPHDSPSESATSNLRPPQQMSPGPQQRASINREDTGATDLKGPGLGTVTAAPTPPSGIKRGEQQAFAGDATPTDFGGRQQGALARIGGLKTVVLGLVGIVVALSAVAAIIVVIRGGEEQAPPPPPTGAMLVEVIPPSNLEIYINDELRGQRAPLTLRDLEPGNYRVEIHHDELMRWRAAVPVRADEVITVNVDLAAEGQLRILLDDPPEELKLYVDGDVVEVEEGEASIELTRRRGRYLIEGFGADVRPARMMAVIEGGQERDITLSWDVSDRLTLTGDTSLDVEFNGRSLGKLPLTLSGLETGRLYELSVGDFETVLGYPELGYAKIDSSQLSEMTTRVMEDYGWVIMELEDDGPWQLVIDEVETGLVFPREQALEIPVAAGERVFGFQRGEQRYDFRVHVVDDEKMIFRPNLPPS